MKIRSFLSHTIFFFLLIPISFFPRPGSAADKKVALLPFVIYSDKPRAFLGPGLKSMFISRLSGEGIEVIGDEKLSPLLTGEDRKGVSSAKRAEELARALGADYAIFGSITSIGTSYSLDLSILDLTKKKPKLTRVSKTMEEDQFIPKLADVVYDFRAIMAGVDIRTQWARQAAATSKKQSPMGLFYRPAGPQDRQYRPSGRVRIRMDVMGFDTGDLNGDGEPELLVMGRKKLLIYNRKGNSLVLKDTLHHSLGEDFIKVSAGDVNGDGSAEIYLVSSIGLRAQSSVWEWSGRFRKVLKMTGHLQVVKAHGFKPVLLFQESLINRYFNGRIAIMVYDGPRKLVRKRLLPEFKKGVQFYTLTFPEPGKRGTEEYLGLNQNAYLCLWDRNGSILWQSDKAVGGTNNAITLGTTFDAASPNIIYFNSRIISADIDNDGKKEILLVDNIRLVEHLQTLRLIVKSNLVAYRMEGAGLVSTLRTPQLPYCLTDIQVQDGTLFLAAQKGEIKLMGPGSGRIIWFE